MYFLMLASDLNQVGGIEKYNHNLYKSLNERVEKLNLIERQKGKFLAKVIFFLKVFFSVINKKPDYIFCCHLNFSPICLFLKFFLKIDYSLSLYGIEIISEHGPLKALGIKNARNIITISQYSKKLITKKYSKIGDRIFILPSTVDSSLFRIKEKNKSLIKKLGILNRPVMLSLARLSTNEHKGQDRVLDCLSNVVKVIPDIVYLIVGAGEDTRVNRILKNKPELRKNVLIIGAIDENEKVDFYNLADVYILPSKFEGFGIVFIESLACGVPVIASDNFGCRQSLKNGNLGLLVKPDNLNNIAKTIINFFNKNVPEQLFKRKYLRKKILEFYGIDSWNKRLDILLRLINT